MPLPEKGFQFVELILTCGSWQEAQKIADALLEKHLVACVEMMEVKSKNWWKGQLEEQKEVKLIMQSIADNFQKAEKLVSELHSYKTPALHALPITQITAGATTWLRNEMGSEGYVY